MYDGSWCDNESNDDSSPVSKTDGRTGGRTLKWHFPSSTDGRRRIVTLHCQCGERHRRRRRRQLVDLKDREEALVEVVEVGPVRVVAEALAAVKMRAEDLEAEHGEDAHDEKEQQEQRGDRLDAVRQRLEQVGEVAPVPVRARPPFSGKRETTIE